MKQLTKVNLKDKGHQEHELDKEMRASNELMAHLIALSRQTLSYKRHKAARLFVQPESTRRDM